MYTTMYNFSFLQLDWESESQQDSFWVRSFQIVYNNMLSHGFPSYPCIPGLQCLSPLPATPPGVVITELTSHTLSPLPSPHTHLITRWLNLSPITTPPWTPPLPRPATSYHLPARNGENRMCECSHQSRETFVLNRLLPLFHQFLPHSIATDDQYASNVPNNIRPDVAMAMESDLASPRQQVSMATRTRGRRDDSSSPREDSSKSPAESCAVDERW